MKYTWPLSQPGRKDKIPNRSLLLKDESKCADTGISLSFVNPFVELIQVQKKISPGERSMQLRWHIQICIDFLLDGRRKVISQTIPLLFPCGSSILVIFFSSPTTFFL